MTVCLYAKTNTFFYKTQLEMERVQRYGRRTANTPVFEELCDVLQFAGAASIAFADESIVGVRAGVHPSPGTVWNGIDRDAILEFREYSGDNIHRMLSISKVDDNGLFITYNRSCLVSTLKFFPDFVQNRS